MHYDEIKDYTEYLFRAALKRCGDINDAEDLTQEVLLAYLSSKKEIASPKIWLASVLRNKYNDMLRRKYKLPLVSIDCMTEDVEPWESYDVHDDRPTEDEVRREVAYLAQKYREVIVRHYLCGEKVEDIAAMMNIPKGTVLSRLSAGRDRMRKGFDRMKNYEKQSYSPERLDIWCHGEPGFNGEPYTLVSDDLLKQNILIVAYDAPVTATEIAHALGIPAAYIESALERLVSSELMRRVGGKYHTDFMIQTTDDYDRSVDIGIGLVERNYDAILGIIKEYLERLGACPVMSEFSDAKRKKAEYYFYMSLMSAAIYAASAKLTPSNEIFPERPNGGKWIAKGLHYPSDFDRAGFKFGKYTYGGERRAYFEDFMNARSVELRVFDTQPDLNKYENGPREMHDEELAKMLYILSRGIPFEVTGFNHFLLENIPHLTECGVLGGEGGRPYVNIPMMRPEEYSQLDKLRCEFIPELEAVITPALAEVLPELMIDVPKHLAPSIADFRKYYAYVPTIAFIKEADERGDIDFAHDVPPMIFIVDDANPDIR